MLMLSNSKQEDREITNVGEIVRFEDGKEERNIFRSPTDLTVPTSINAYDL